ncbi:MAG: DUF2508 family protein [Oscillospiraceae bacterium]
MELITLNKAFQKKSAVSKPDADLISQIKTLEKNIRTNENIFNITTDPTLIDAVIYENMALRIRYGYLMNIARENNISCKPLNSSACL